MTVKKLNSYTRAVEMHYRKSITMANVYKEQGCNDLSKYDKDVLAYDSSMHIRLSAGDIDIDKLMGHLEHLKEDNSIITPQLTLLGYIKANKHSRKDVFDYVQLFNRGYRIMSEDGLMILVKKRVRRQLSKMAKVDAIECKLLEQFMMGNLTYQQVINGSKKGCEI